ncbi:maleylacetate reductase [Ruegeria sp. HKCCD8929]|uniref:maleylacetate reductase n=1 Tax=Ruegeria sp. HKCCD8929 TaxID=2683006 RepID=UPI001487F7F4|nr:maleylacetate reductase [Ruegeria sp. HKCCD8929]
MTLAFEYTGSPAKIVFGSGSRGRVREMMDDLGCKRALVLATPFQKPDAESLAEDLGGLSTGVFANATMHTPTDVTEQAMVVLEEADADCVVSLGGGSTTGLGKAIAYRTDLPQIVIPTSYAGSEVTPILGQTEGGTKTTLSSPRALPEVVLYDPDLTVGLPVGMSVTSGLNAIAHAAEALYAKDRNPVSTLMASDGIRALVDALPKIVENPSDMEARGNALYGTWLCGSVLGTVGMALHHKLCHTLGGAFDLPHADTHTVILPHAVAFNAAEVPELLAPIADALGHEMPGLGLHEFAKSLGAPTTLIELGMPEDGIDHAADLAMANPYWNPRKLERPLVRRLIEKAFHGLPPAR